MLSVISVLKSIHFVTDFSMVNSANSFFVLLCNLWLSSFADETVIVNVCCGLIAGVVSSAMANPTDVLKVRICRSQAMWLSAVFYQLWKN